MAYKNILSRLIRLLGFFVIFSLLFYGIWKLLGPKDQPASRSFAAMDTVMSLTAYGENADAALDEAVAEVNRLDRLFSTGRADSEVSRLNAAGRLTVSEDTAQLLERAVALYEDTGGLFDPTVYPLVELWGFPTKEYRVPTESEIQELLPLVDGGAVSLAGNEAALAPGQAIDLGGIAKGYASARLAEIFAQHHVTSALIDLGHNIQAVGARPDGTPWRVAVQDPVGDGGDWAAVVEVTDEAVVTSGGYERFFEENGETYIHIIDPRTGKPAASDLLSVTIVSPDGALADGLSTALYIMGSQDAAQWWAGHSQDFQMVLVKSDHTLIATPGLRDRLETSLEVRFLETP